MIFPRDKNGRIAGKDKKGEYSTNVDVSMRVKCHDKMRFAPSVAMVKMLDGNVEGKRCELIDYTGKVVISRPEEEKIIQDEILRVKALTSS